MKLFAILVIICCVFLNFTILQDTDNQKKITKRGTVKTHTEPLKKSMDKDVADSVVLRKTEQKFVDPPAGAPKELNLPFRRLAAPSFYKGIYLHNYSARVFRVLKRFVKQAKKVGINTFVLDLQDAVYFRTYMVSRKNIKYLMDNGIYPIARIVVFSYGLKRYPVPRSLIRKRYNLALRAARAGFPEVQFDYIRFEDSGRLRWVSKKKRFALVEGFLSGAKKMLRPYGVKISADIFGRVALNRNDPIGQRLEGLDRSVDILCPMVYPSHYSWSRYMMANPYYTVYKSGIMAKKRLKHAKLVMYIQGFIMRVRYSGLSLPVYIAHQMKASKDAGTRGYIVWNAAQRYWPTYKALRLLNSGKPLPGLYKKKKKIKRRRRVRKKIVLSEDSKRIRVKHD